MTAAGVTAALAEYRDVREQLERSILPLATSVDGRRFTFQTSLHDLELETGAYVVLERDGAERLGQLLSLELGSDDASGPDLPPIRIRFGRGDGAVLDGDGRPFHDAAMRPARPEEVGAWLERIRPDRACLPVAELALAPGVPFE
ncbi:MAG TPA: hypothetical protein VJT68_10010, partial [Thermoleophilaceae bacterium]|nr:hypothetical protein [Thermoleophilaceae bacterium]